MKIMCTISTPQFRPDGTIREFKKQTGLYNLLTHKFETAELFGHNVHFRSHWQFLKFKVKR